MTSEVIGGLSHKSEVHTSRFGTKYMSSAPSGWCSQLQQSCGRPQLSVSCLQVTQKQEADRADCHKIQYFLKARTDNYPFLRVIRELVGLTRRIQFVIFDGFRTKTPFNNILIHNRPIGLSMLCSWLTPMKQLNATDYRSHSAVFGKIMDMQL